MQTSFKSSAQDAAATFIHSAVLPPGFVSASRASVSTCAGRITFPANHEVRASNHDQLLVELGEALFFDKRLIGNRAIVASRVLMHLMHSRILTRDERNDLEAFLNSLTGTLARSPCFKTG